MRNITYLSAPAEVSMGDKWYEIATLDHFWIHRRFDVLLRLAGGPIANAREMAEVGCGHGLLQLQIERSLRRKVTGFDLNEVALKQNVSLLSPIYCYDIYQKDAALRERFDLIFLFDVLEHIEEEDKFLSALLFHLAPSGQVIVNVPVGQWAYSVYDRAVGHVRRYAILSLQNAAKRNDLKVAKWSYWGLPLVPALFLRKFWLLESHEQDEIISTGLNPRTGFMNQLLGLVSRCEPIPQTFLGTSLMAVLQRGGDSRGRP